MSSAQFLAAIAVLWIFVTTLALMTLRACAYVVHLSDQIDFVKLRVGRSDEVGLRVGDLAPDFVVEKLDNARILMSAVWSQRGAVVLFVSASCEHCELLLVDLWHRSAGAADNLLVVSGDSRERTRQWLRMIVQGDPAFVANVVTSTELSTRLVFAYNPGGTFPWYVSVGSDGVVREVGPAVKRNPAWTQQVASLCGSEG